MAHIETKDPFGFVGTHVVRRKPRRSGEEHGWLTRYNEALDCYTLFVPGGGEPRILSRGEVMKYLSAPNIELHDNDQDEFPPPVKDITTSRYLGVKVLRQSHQVLRLNRSGEVDDIWGQVTCYLPFGDRYRVEYDDGSSDEMSESAVIDGIIALVKSPSFSQPYRQKMRRNRLVKITQRRDAADEEARVVRRRKRQRVEINADKYVQEIGSDSDAGAENAANPQTDNGVNLADQRAGEGDEAETVLNISEKPSSAIAASGRTSLEMASCPEEPINLVAVVHNDKDQVTAKVLKMPAELANSKMPHEDKSNEAGKQKTIPIYVMKKKLHKATEPLPRRAMAFEILRAALVNMMNRPEANAIKTVMQYNLLRNPDVRDRDAVLRFLDDDGLLVLNYMLNLFSTEALKDNESIGDLNDKMRDQLKRDNEVLHVLKIVAMLPTPSRDQVIASSIGKTINYLCKMRGPPGRESVLPTCIIDLAKWIKSSWIKNIPPAAKSVSKASCITRNLASRPQQQARRGGRGGSPGRPSIRLNLRRPPPLHRPQREFRLASRESTEEQDVAVDNTPIPRLSRGKQSLPLQEPEAVVASTPQLPTSRPVTGGLKPDWMRQKENLARSRFCIDTTNLDKNCRDRQTRNGPGVAAPVTLQKRNPDQHEDAGGPDGVFGRPQRLRFGKRWSIQEYSIKDPPSTITQPPKTSHTMPINVRSQYSEQERAVQVPSVPYSTRPPRSILRRISRYNDEPAIDGPVS
ncbi:hypothetical protein CCR75_002328 [Bremia lactucae]|uniref:Uncharacterized protein n=1 Tax=Bremia lactucae TaxID=4779 RepID=A0A976NZC8_BRELC|nr:hypothetical protein CCR75_002328 [Bremia lactucae]